MVTNLAEKEVPTYCSSTTSSWQSSQEAPPLGLFQTPPFARQHAAELVAKVASHYDEYVSVKDLGDKINRALVAAKKDNDFIYHDRVPEVKDLEPIGKAALVKATAVTPPISQKFTGETPAPSGGTNTA